MGVSRFDRGKNTSMQAEFPGILSKTWGIKNANIFAPQRALAVA